MGFQWGAWGQVCLLDLSKSPVPAGNTAQVDCITYRSRPTEPVPVKQLLVGHGQVNSRCPGQTWEMSAGRVRARWGEQRGKWGRRVHGDSGNEGAVGTSLSWNLTGLVVSWVVICSQGTSAVEAVGRKPVSGWGQRR